MSAPWETADNDQFEAAAKEVATADISSWLLPDGLAESVVVCEDDSATGPATRAAVLFLTRPKVPGCELASRSRIPLFGITSDVKGHVYCAACFEQLLAVMFHPDRAVWHCTLCSEPSSHLRPIITSHAVLTLVAYSCESCYLAEKRAVVSSKFSKIARRVEGRH